MAVYVALKQIVSLGLTAVGIGITVVVPDEVLRDEGPNPVSQRPRRIEIH